LTDDNDDNDTEKDTEEEQTFKTTLRTNRYEQQLWEEYEDYTKLSSDEYNHALHLSVEALKKRRKFWAEINRRNHVPDNDYYEMIYHKMSHKVTYKIQDKVDYQALDHELSMAEAEVNRLAHKIERLNARETDDPTE